MPNFKKNTSSAMKMKRSAFQMKGYSYPGESPVRGMKANMKRSAATTSANSAIDEANAILGKEVKSSSILLTENNSPLADTDTDVDPEGFWDSLKTSAGKELGKAGTSAIVSGIGGAIAAGGKKGNVTTGTGANMPQITGSSSNIV